MQINVRIWPKSGYLYGRGYEWNFLKKLTSCWKCLLGFGSFLGLFWEKKSTSYEPTNLVGSRYLWEIRSKPRWCNCCISGTRKPPRSFSYCTSCGRFAPIADTPSSSGCRPERSGWHSGRADQPEMTHRDKEKRVVRRQTKKIAQLLPPSVR